MSDDEMPPMGGEGEYGDDDYSDDDGDYQPPSELPDGMKKEIVTQASSDNWKKPKAGDEVKIHYVGTLESDGSEFVSSRGNSDAFSFHLGKGAVIKGFDLGVATMKKGEVAKFTIAPEFLTGDVPEKIPKDSTVVFEVELLGWITKDDLFGDEGAVKAIVEEGTGWKNPKAGDEILLDLKCEETGENRCDFEYTVGSGALGDLGKVCDKAFTGMKKGEVASLAVSKDYAPAGKEAVTVTLKLKEIYDTKDVSLGKDKSVMKKQIKEGEGYETPKDSSTVKLVVESATDGSNALPGFKTATLSFTAGNGEVCDALEAAAINMKKGERAVLNVTDIASIREKGLGLEGVKAEKVVLTIELPEFEKAKDTWNLSEDEKVVFGGQRKEVGTTLFKAGRFSMAVQRYKQVVDLFSSIDNYQEENKEKAKTLKKSCDLNLSACYLKLEDWTETKATCNKILKDERTNVKALYRRAQAEHGLKNYTECMKDCKEVVQLDSQNREARALLKQAQTAQKEVDKQAKGMFANMCKALGKGPIPEPGKSKPEFDDMDDDDYEADAPENKKEDEADATATNGQ